MNALLQRHCAKFIYIVPDGLRELMSDISRELIRNQPENIYTFIADYLDALMITRENARIAARLVDNICAIAETVVGVLVRTGLSREEADAIATIIQTVFRAYLERKKFYHTKEEFPGEYSEEEEFVQNVMREVSFPVEKREVLAQITQNAFRKFKERQEREKRLLFGIVDWRIAARSAIALYRQTGVTKYEANRAAALIQAAYKGYYTRRNIQRLLERGITESDITITTEVSSLTKAESSEYTGEEPFEYYDEYSFEDEVYEFENVESVEEEVIGEGPPMIRPVIRRRKVVKRKESKIRQVSETKVKEPEVADDYIPVMQVESIEGVETHEAESLIGDGYEDESFLTDMTESEGKQPPPNTEDEEEPLSEVVAPELPQDVAVDEGAVAEEIAHQADANEAPAMNTEEGEVGDGKDNVEEDDD